MALAALAVLAIVTLLARRAPNSGALGRLRALFPSWRLFDRAAGSPQLLVRFAAAGELGAWLPIAGAPRGRAGWAFAPSGNLGLAYHAVVEQLVAELGELELELEAEAALVIETDPAVVGLVSYELVTRIARSCVPAGARFQWKLVVPGEPAVDYLQSPVIAA